MRRVPVVATRQGGVPEVVREGENGFLAEVGDVETMAAAVKRLLTDGALHARMSASARASTVKDFAMEPMIDRWVAYYRKFISSSR